MAFLLSNLAERFRRSHFFLLFFLFYLLASPLAAEVLKIGLVPEVNIFRQVERFVPLIRYLEEQTGLEIEGEVARSYVEILEKLAQGELDGAFGGSYVGAVAVADYGARPVARIEYLDGASHYQGLILVRSDQDVDSIADLRGKVMAMVDPATTAGYLWPVAHLRQKDLGTPESFFSEIFFTGSHDGAIRAVASGQADVAAAKNTVFAHLLTEEPEVVAGLRVLASSPQVPTVGLLLSSQIDALTERRLREALLELGDQPDRRRILGGFNARRFVLTRAEDYAPVQLLLRSSSPGPPGGWW